MKPKPFSELNHLTVPVAMYFFSFGLITVTLQGNEAPVFLFYSWTEYATTGTAKRRTSEKSRGISQILLSLFPGYVDIHREFEPEFEREI